MPPVLSLALLLIAADPVAIDKRLVIERFAAEPEIVTPTGIAVDAKGRVLVIESHTHFRPEGYKGPTSDRIRRFEDTDGDGKADRVATVFEGTRMTMALAVDRDESLVVATRNEVFRLRDADGDGTFEAKTTLVRLDTPGDYPHNGLSGVAFDAFGTIHFGLGENLGADYKLIGSDGKTLVGGGEGGNIYRCDPDGKALTRLATGFWNPFALAFDPFGRLFAVDNDPDSRPPCRLLHVVEDGDYGYRFRNGRKGLHPFTSWNGELPGTLPMVAGTGEAPSGLVVYESDNLPQDYRGDILATSWGDHRIERFRLRPKGASFESRAEAIVSGGEDFRPVGIALAPDGSLYLSDWVDKSYNVHGKGRIWHLRAVSPAKRERPDDPPLRLVHPDLSVRRSAARTLLDQGDDGRAALQKVLSSNYDPRARAVAFEALIGSPRRAIALKAPSPDVRALAVSRLSDDALDATLASSDPSPLVRAEALRRLSGRGDEARRAMLLKAFESDDPFLLAAAARQAAGSCLGSEGLMSILGDSRDPIPSHRLQAFLSLRWLAEWSNDTSRGEAALSDAIPKALDDPDPSLRFAALQWIYEKNLGRFRPLVESGLARASSRTLFEACLATLARLDGKSRRPDQEVPGEEYVLALLKAPETSPAVRSRALRMLRPDHPFLTTGLLLGWINGSDRDLHAEGLRTLRESPIPDRLPALATIAAERARPAAERAEAIVGLTADTPERRSLLLSLLNEDEPLIRRESLRSLRGAALSDTERTAIRERSAGDPESVALSEMLSGTAAEGTRPKLTEVDAWLAILDGPADPAAGSRVYFHPSGPGCYRCHTVDGRGGKAGPDLTVTGQTLDRRRLVESILQPSKEVAPQFTPWSIAKTDGTIVTGLLVGESATGEQTYVDAEGKRFTLSPAEIAERRTHTASIMPDRLPYAMTVPEFRDLIAFLQSGVK